MITLDNVAVADNYPTENAQQPAAIMYPAHKSNGGYFTVSNNPVYVELAYNIGPADHGYGQTRWTKEIPFPTGPAILLPGTVGVRFRNYTPGSAATVSGALAEEAEPSITVTSSGVVSGAKTTTITGDVAANGSINAGTGFSVVRNGVGDYSVTFTNAFPAIPAMTVTYIVGAANSAFCVPDFVTLTVNGFRINTFDRTGTPGDCRFQFIAQNIS